MDLEGRFTSPDELADILRRAGAEGLSGTLTIRCGVSFAASFQYYRGQLAGSDNPDRHRRLGRILLNRGLIDRAALEEALAYQADFAPGTPIGKVLVHRGKLGQAELVEAVRLQIEDEMSAVLTCIEGFYQIVKADGNDEEPPAVLLDTQALVDETVARQKEWEKIRQKVPNDSVIPAVLKLKGPEDREVLHLTPRQWHVLSLVNGYYDVGCIAARSGLGRFETYKTLDSLLGSRVIELHPPREPVADSMNADGESPAAENSSPNAKAAGSSSSRWGSLLARLREEGDPRPDTGGEDKVRLDFNSPVSFLVDVCNRILARLMTNQDFVVDPTDEKLAERYWRQVLMTFPRADLITANMNLLEATTFDRYTRTLGVDGAMRSIYLDTMDAISRYMRTLYLLSAQRLGSRSARMLFVDVMEDVKSRATIANAESFFFKEFAAETLA